MQAAQPDTAVKITGASGLLVKGQVVLTPSVDSYKNISIFLTVQIKLGRVNTTTGNIYLYQKVQGKCQHFLLHFTLWIKISLKCFSLLQKSY
jgi:hypothetical protein